MNEVEPDSGIPLGPIMAVILTAAIAVISATAVVISVPGLEHWLIKGLESILHIAGGNPLPVPEFRVHYFLEDSMGHASMPGK
jgi:hypothetical protein